MAIEQLDPTSMLLLQKIIVRKTIPQQELLEQFNYSKSQLRYKLKKIKLYLKDNNIPEIWINNGLILSSFSMDDILALTAGTNAKKSKTVIGLATNTRNCLEAIMIFCFKEPVSIAHFIDVFHISKNTGLNDIKKIKEMSNNVQLCYTREKGYHFIGKSEDIRKIMLNCLANIRRETIFEDTLDKILPGQNFKKIYDSVYTAIKETLSKYDIAKVTSYEEQMVGIITMLQYHVFSTNRALSDVDLDVFKGCKLCDAAVELNNLLPKKLPDAEIGYLAAMLLCISGNESIPESVAKQDEKLVKAIVNDLSSRFALIINKPEIHKMHEELFMHMQKAYCRMRYGFAITNPYLPQLKQDNAPIFKIVSMIASKYDKYFVNQIDEAELGYITMYLMAMLDVQDNSPWSFNALLICFDGRETEALIYKNLSILFPDIQLTISEGNEDAQNFNAFDVVFSTAAPNELCTKPWFEVDHLMNRNKEKFLKQDVYDVLYRKKTGKSGQFIGTEKLMRIIGKYSDVRDSKGLYQALDELTVYEREQIIKQSKQLTLKDLLTRKTIQFKDGVSSWEEAIALGAQPLLEAGAITEQYITCMIKNINDRGAYIIVCPEIAVAHARSEDGVSRVGISLLKLKNPVFLLGEPQNRLTVIITLAAVDSKKHIPALAEFAEIISNKEKCQGLLSSKSAADIINLI